MRTDDLRTMLHDHADEVAPLAAHGRVAAVHDRIGTARRRRRAAVTGAVLTAVAAISLSVVPGLDRPGADPAADLTPERLAGWSVPDTLESTGYAYEYVRGVESEPGAKRLALVLPESDEPRLLAWASDSEDNQATVSLVVDGEERSRSTAGALETFHLLGPGTEYHVVLRQDRVAPDDRLGLATFELSDQPPAGLTKDAVTYRQDVAGQRLVGAAIGDRGETDVRLDITVPGAGLRWSDLCYGVGYGADHGFMVNTSIDGHLLGATSCARTRPFDPGRDGVTFDDGAALLRGWGIEPGDRATVRVWLSDAQDKTHAVVEHPDAVIGLGVYEDRLGAVGVAGGEVPELVEYEGRVWTPTAWFEAPPGGARIERSVQKTDAPTLVYTMATGLADHARLRLVVDGRIHGIKLVDTGGEEPATSSGPELVVPAGTASEISLEVRQGATDRTRLAILLYEPTE